MNEHLVVAQEWADRADRIARAATEHDPAIDAFALVSIAQSLLVLAAQSDGPTTVERGEADEA